MLDFDLALELLGENPVERNRNYFPLQKTSP